MLKAPTLQKKNLVKYKFLKIVTRILDILNMRIKNFRKRNGLDELKYIAVLEYREATDDKRTKTRIHHHIIISGMDRDKAEELWGKGMANANRMQANELGFEELANYLSKDPRGKKRWSQSKNIVIPVPEIKDYKYSNKKII